MKAEVQLSVVQPLEAVVAGINARELSNVLGKPFEEGVTVWAFVDSFTMLAHDEGPNEPMVNPHGTFVFQVFLPTDKKTIFS